MDNSIKRWQSLTTQQILEIKSRASENISTLAREYNVEWITIYRVLRGK
jgi:hypothetical protein